MDGFPQLPRPRLLAGGGGALLAALGYGLWVVLRQVLMVVLVLTIVVLVVVIVYLLLRSRRAARASDEIEASISKQADRDIEESGSESKEQLRDLKSELLAAIEALKKSKRGAAGGRGALSRLPWYLVLGLPHAGKESLIRSSGLHFPGEGGEGEGGPRSFRGVGGTRGFEWWLSDEAVLLDMPGEFLKQVDAGESDDWSAFLGTLRKHRPHRPLNGILLVVSVDQLGSLPDAELAQLGQTLRRRMRDLTHRLGVVPPTYLVVTRCDQLLGFSEFFAGLGENDRLQPWGATLPVAARSKEPVDARFDTEFDLLLEAVSARRLDVLAPLTDPVQRARVYGFPMQLRGLRAPLRRLLRLLFEAGGETDAPLLRGFYLTAAGAKTGVVDHIFGEAASAMGVAIEALAQPESAAGVSWFVRDLFSRVILADRSLATRSSYAEMLRNRMRRLTFAGLGFILLVIAAVLSGLSCSNLARYHRIETAAAQLRTARATGDFPSRLRALDELRAGVVRLEEGDRNRWRRLTGYPVQRVAEPARQLHTIQSLKILAEPALQTMDMELRRQLASGRAGFVPLFWRYCAWRLLMKPTDLTPDWADVVAAQTRLAFGSQLRGCGADSTLYGDMLQRNVRFAASQPQQIAAYRGMYRPAAPDSALMDQAETWIRLNSGGRSTDLYQMVLAEARPATRALDLRAMVGKRDEDLLASKASVPGPYTKAGWERVMRARLRWFRERMDDPWMRDAFPGFAGALPGELERRYADEYARAWGGFLAGVQAIPAREWGAASTKLSRLRDGKSTLFRELERAARETDLGDDVPAEVAKVRSDFAALQEIVATPRGAEKRGFWSGVGRFFGGIFRWRRSAAEGSIRERYDAWSKALLTQVQKRAEPGKGNEDFGIYLASDKQASLVSQLYEELCNNRMLEKHPAGQTVAVNRFLQLPLHLLPRTPPEYVARVPAGGGGVGPGPGPGPVEGCRMEPETCEAWQREVVAFFDSALANRFPLVRGASRDVDPVAFGRFFAPGGIFWTFFDERLAKYVLEDGSFKEAGSSAYVTPELQRAVAQARAIRDNLNWAADGPSLRFDIQPEPPEPPKGTPPNVPLPNWTELEIGGREPIRYMTGEPRLWIYSVEWPGPDLARGTAVRGALSGKPALESAKTGPWGLFHLLDKAEVTYLDTERVTRARFSLKSGTSDWYVPYRFRFTGTEAKQPFQKGLLEFQLPRKL